MNDELYSVMESAEGMSEEYPSNMITLFPGVKISYISFEAAPFGVKHKHIAMDNIMLINYCRTGQLEWKMGNDNYFFLNPGDISLHTMRSCTDSRVSFPSGSYSGLTIYVNLHEASAYVRELIGTEDCFLTDLLDKFCPSDNVAFLAGSEPTEAIFSFFYGQPEEVINPYRKLKTMELLLYLSKLEFSPEIQVTAYHSDLVEIIRRIHDSMTERIGERITIDELSKQYLINPTTLKSAFKAVYGNSIAAHIKEHRMEQAAKMLRSTDESIADIARAVGYDSQSKFTAAFKASFQILPREYRKGRK